MLGLLLAKLSKVRSCVCLGLLECLLVVHLLRKKVRVWLAWPSWGVGVGVGGRGWGWGLGGVAGTLFPVRWVSDEVSLSSLSTIIVAVVAEA